jgi:hypothetical protein
MHIVGGEGLLLTVNTFLHIGGVELPEFFKVWDKRAVNTFHFKMDFFQLHFFALYLPSTRTPVERKIV